MDCANVGDRSKNSAEQFRDYILKTELVWEPNYNEPDNMIAYMDRVKFKLSAVYEIDGNQTLYRFEFDESKGEPVVLSHKFRCVLYDKRKYVERGDKTMGGL